MNYTHDMFKYIQAERQQQAQQARLAREAQKAQEQAKRDNKA